LNGEAFLLVTIAQPNKIEMINKEINVIILSLIDKVLMEVTKENHVATMC